MEDWRFPYARMSNSFDEDKQEQFQYILDFFFFADLNTRGVFPLVFFCFRVTVVAPFFFVSQISDSFRRNLPRRRHVRFTYFLHAKKKFCVLQNGPSIRRGIM